MVQIETLSTPECQEGVPSQGGQHREEHCTLDTQADTTRIFHFGILEQF